MGSNNPLSNGFVWEFAFQLPLWVAYLVGIILVAIHWRDHRRPSRLAMCGLIALLFSALLSFLYRWIAFQGNSQSWTGSQINNTLWAIIAVRSMISPIGIGFLFFAVYSSRLPPAARRAERVRDLDFPFDQPKRPSAPAAPVEVAPNAGIREQKG